MEHGRKNQVKNMCMHRVWLSHGFGECMGLVGRMVRLDLIEGRQVFENGKM